MRDLCVFVFSPSLLAAGRHQREMFEMAAPKWITFLPMPRQTTFASWHGNACSQLCSIVSHPVACSPTLPIQLTPLRNAVINSCDVNWKLFVYFLAASNRLCPSLEQPPPPSSPPSTTAAAEEKHWNLLFSNSATTNNNSQQRATTKVYSQQQVSFRFEKYFHWIQIWGFINWVRCKPVPNAEHYNTSHTVMNWNDGSSRSTAQHSKTNASETMRKV